MFARLGKILADWWPAVIGVWLVATCFLHLTAPPFDQLAKGGEFVFLPERMDSRQGELLLSHAFPERKASSNMVIVAHRDDQPLTDDDRSFIDDTLRPALEEIRERVNSNPNAASSTSNTSTNRTGIITQIQTFSEPGIGTMLVSEDQKASLISIGMGIDFQDNRNWKPVQDVEDLLNRMTSEHQVPNGLQLALTGSATLGRDISKAESDSARTTCKLTVGLVLVLLLVIYRAPLIALVPLLTLFVAVDVALLCLTLLAQPGYVPLFKGLQEYTTVTTYGPGIDYCLFLIARYKENLEKCLPPKQALSEAIGQVGEAIAASAATVICGIGMLSFAQFGKFHEAGIGISFALLITLIATLTLTPALLFLVGHWAFWPMPGVSCSENADQGAVPGEHAVQNNLFQPIWSYMGGIVERHPVPLLCATFAAMIPFVIFAVIVYQDVSYGLLESLPKSATSAAGARVLESHFPAGITGPVGILIQNSDVNFRDNSGIDIINGLTEKLMARREELKISDIRSVSNPLGMSESAQNVFSSGPAVLGLFERNASRRKSIEHYVTSLPTLDGHITEMEVVLVTNPFAVESVQAMERLTQAIRDGLPPEEANRTVISYVGPTASVRDVELISKGDQQRIYVMVVSCVFVILVALLRSFSISLYLIVTVLLSYMMTLAVTWLFFHGLDPAGFVGLDWTVPLFLFVVLIAIGEDYNIFLVTRIREEQKTNGAVHGIGIALSKTGGIITSCGFIMAGTFASLGAGSLSRMQQLGFALAFGVMLDTFVIRPVLVPAFMTLINDEHYGNLARYLK